MIRAYRPDDWHAVSEIYDLAKPDEMRGAVPAESVPRLSEHPEMLALFGESRIVVAEVDARVVGFAGYRGAAISWLFVHPGHRGTGIATSLMGTVLVELAGRATLNVAKSNARARRLYERLGFVVEREFVGTFNEQACDVIKLRYGPAVEASVVKTEAGMAAR
jgi:ribosomal protein S18 acetylase RimI-like enzyme